LKIGQYETMANEYAVPEPPPLSRQKVSDALEHYVPAKSEAGSLGIEANPAVTAGFLFYTQ